MYSKHSTALESDPEIFSKLLHRLTRCCQGAALSRSSEPRHPRRPVSTERPPLALIVIYRDTDQAAVPGTARFKACMSKEVIWTKQTINNDCGLYAILHAAFNGPTKAYVREHPQ